MAKLKWYRSSKGARPHALVVIREKGDPVFYGVGMGAGESKFLHWVKTMLIKRYGWDLIKKLMWKDGHMVEDTQHCIRSRYPSTKPNILFWNDHYAIRGLEEDFRVRGEARLAVTSAWEPFAVKEATMKKKRRPGKR